MPFTYTLTSVTKLGDNDPKYGQRYWVAAPESDLPMMFNSMSEDIDIGDTITCEETANARSAKGTDYLKLKKVRVAEQGTHTSPPAQKPVTEPQNGSDKPNGWDAAKLFMQLNRIEEKLDKLLGDDDEITQAGKSIQQALEDGDDMPDNFLTENM